MFKGQEKLFPIIAMIVLLIGIFSAVYVNAIQINKETITINDQEYSIDELFMIGTKKTILTNDGEKTGISLDNLIKELGIVCGECHQYTFRAKDGYQQTVNWDFMKKGVLAENNRIFFSDSAHALWVRDVIEIEVI